VLARVAFVDHILWLRLAFTSSAKILLLSAMAAVRVTFVGEILLWAVRCSRRLFLAHLALYSVATRGGPRYTRTSRVS
jgi:hypothetical protein